MVKKPTEELTVDKIQEVVCEHFNIPSELYRRKPENVRWYKPVNWLCISVKLYEVFFVVYR